jgi:hypothetical protein
MLTVGCNRRASIAVRCNSALSQALELAVLQLCRPAETSTAAGNGLTGTVEC